jgi:hypothetical protein
MRRTSRTRMQARRRRKRTGVVAPPNLGKMSSTIRERAIRMRLDLAPEGHRQGPLEAIARLVAIAQFGK